MSDLTTLTMRDASEAIRKGELSPVALVDAYLDRIAAVDGSLHSYILVLADEARAAAKKAEAEIGTGKWRGPLHGLPYGVKDNYYTKGIRTCCNSRVLMDFKPDFDATAITRLTEAGAILLGKLNAFEYGTSMGPAYHDLPYPLARNPWDTDRFTGGSSTGSGASVAGRTAMFALGTDTGGSIRLPAAACGLQGHKATSGLVSRAGILPNCWAFDIAGPLCWSVWDCAAVLQAIAGYDAADPQSVNRPVDDYLTRIGAGIAGMRIGVILDLDCDGVHPDPAVLANIEAASKVLEAQGAVLVPVALPAPVGTYRQSSAVINWAESYAIHEHDFTEHGDKMGQALSDKMMAGFHVRAVDYISALRERRVLADATEALMQTVDLLLVPGAFHVAPRFSDHDKVTAYTGETAMIPFNMSGHPAITVCTGFDHDGIPTSAQIVGQWFDDATVLRAAYAYEQATPWRDKFPLVSPAKD